MSQQKRGQKFSRDFSSVFLGLCFFILREIPFFFKCFKSGHMMTFTMLLFASSMWPAGADMYLNSSGCSEGWEDPRFGPRNLWWMKIPSELRLGPRGSNNKLREQSNNVQKLGKKKRRNVFRGYLCCGVSGDTPLGLQFTWYLLVFFFAFFAFLSMFLRNANRLFDSQNNAASGYQIGDDCKPACKDENNNYDVTVEGATKGAMKFYQGSELYIEWHHQHGCGVGHPNLRCQNLG